MIERKYQTFWRRFWAGWIDFLIFVPLYLLSKLVWKNYQALPVFLILCWYIIDSLSSFIYRVLMHGKLGQTLGKMVTRVKVLDISEGKLTMSQAIKRDIIPIGLSIIGIVLEVPRILSRVNIMDPASIKFDASFYIITFTNSVWFVLEIITMLFSKKRRALHDFIAGSVVIRLTQKTSLPDR